MIKRLFLALTFIAALFLPFTTATSPSTAAGASSAEYRSVTHNKFGRQVTWWYTRVDDGSGPKEWIPDSIRMCGGSGEYGYPRFRGRSFNGGFKYGPTFLGDYATDGSCSWWDVDPTTKSDIGFYSNGVPRAEVGFALDLDGDNIVESIQYWSVDGSSGQIAAYERPAQGGHLSTQDYVLLP